MRASDVTISKLLSLMLRHRPQDFGLTLEPDGWTGVEGVLAALAARELGVTAAELTMLVRASDKQRFAISPDGRRIRANQGHSVEVSLGYEPAGAGRQVNRIGVLGELDPRLAPRDAATNLG